MENFTTRLKDVFTNVRLLRLCVLIPFFGHLLPCMAEDQLLQIWHSDGTVRTIKLYDEPVTSYADDKLIITTQSGTTITLPLDKVMKYTFMLGDVNGIEGVRNERTFFTEDGRSFTFKGLKNGSDILVYSMSGIEMKRVKVDSEVTTVTLKELPNGAYLVKANGITYKTIKR